WRMDTMRLNGPPAFPGPTAKSAPPGSPISVPHNTCSRPVVPAAPQSSIPGLGGGRFPAMLGVPHGRSLRVRLADSLCDIHGPRLAGTRQGLNAQLLSTLERDLVPAPTPFAQPLSEQAYRRL